jgi:hypothetical protein
VDFDSFCVLAKIASFLDLGGIFGAFVAKNCPRSKNDPISDKIQKLSKSILKFVALLQKMRLIGSFLKK